MKLWSKSRIIKLYGFLLITVLVIQTSCVVAQFSDKQELAKNRLLWKESGVKSYRMTVDLQKTGHATPMGKFIITVCQGTAVSIRTVDENRLIFNDRMFDRYDTIENIFDYIEIEIKESKSWHIKDIEYDSKLGYPKKVNFDSPGVDDEFSFDVLNFEVLSDEQAKSTLIPSDWKEINICEMSFYVPKDLENKNLKGLDSCIAQFSSDKIDITIDYGWYGSPPEKEKDMLNYYSDIFNMDGKEALLATFKRPQNERKLKYIADVYVDLSNPGDNDAMTNSLDMTIAVENEDELETAKRILKTIRFNKK